MTFSLVIDDVSLFLLLSIILILSISLYISPSYSPLIHPLILSRQSDVSKVRQANQSPIYRNANSPSGFQLANKPRRKVVDVQSIIKIGSTGSEGIGKKWILGRQVEGNGQVEKDSKCLIQGLHSVINKASNDSLALGIHTAGKESYGSLISLLASGERSAGKGDKTISTLVIPSGGSGSELPTSIPLSNQSINALFVGSLSSSQLKEILQLPCLSANAVIIVEQESQVQQIAGFKFISFDQLLQAGKQVGNLEDSSTVEPETFDEESRLNSIHSHYWKEGSWIPVSQGHLTSGLTSQMALFPADKIPTTNDHILVEESKEDELLSSSQHPAGLVLDLLAIYTGASLTREIIKETEPLSCKPTLLYTSSNGASSLSSQLTSRSKSSFISNTSSKAKLTSLRHGCISIQTFWDKIFFNNVRIKFNLSGLRNVFIQDSATQVSQDLLDSLRTTLGCSVTNSYLPNQVLHSRSSPITSLVTSPITSSHTLDLQAFSPEVNQFNKEGISSTHSGPPSVSLEIMLTDDSKLAKAYNIKVDQNETKPQNEGERGDFVGELLVRGKSITSSKEQEWVSTGDLAKVRSNGTFVILKSQNENKNSLLSSRSSSVHKKQRCGNKTAKLSTALALSLSLISCVEANKEYDVPVRQLVKRESYSPNSSLADACRMGMLSSPRATWEQGTAQSALLEFEHGRWSVFNGEKNGPPFRPGSIDTSQIDSHPPWSVVSLAYRSSNTQDGLGRLGVYVTGDEPGGNASTGSSLDSASMGEGILLSAFVTGQLQDGVLGSGMYARSAQRQLDYLLKDVIRLPNGAISQRINTQEIWSDSLYMLPPFLAAYGLYTSNQSLLQQAYDQIRLDRDLLRIQEGAGEGLFMHIYNGTNITRSDTGAWVTGNGWSTAGMVRTLASIAQSPFSSEMVQQKTDLAEWTNEILDKAYPFLDSGSNLFHNYINATGEFLDASGSALMAYSTFRLASMSPAYAQHVEEAESIYQAIQDKVSPAGIYSGVDSVYALGFTTPGPTSAEALAFNLLLMAARRDYHQGNVTGLDGPGTGNENSSVQAGIKTSSIVALIGIVSLGLALL